MTTPRTHLYKFENPRPQMAKIKSKNTDPELRIRRLLLDMGFRGYRIHYDRLPGKPDIVFTKRKRVIFVHGCFWHGHDCPAGSHKPKTNRSYWIPKLLRNIERDKEHQRQIAANGWKVFVVWECQLRHLESVEKRLKEFLLSHNADGT